MSCRPDANVALEILQSYISAILLAILAINYDNFMAIILTKPLIGARTTPLASL